MATHDYVIDNSTGANVRTDLNNVLQAILTNNSSGSAPSTTAAYMLWADTSNNLLKMRNSANDGWIDLRTLTGGVTTSADATINSLTVGKGANSVGGNTVLGQNALDASVSGANNTAIGFNALTKIGFLFKAFSRDFLLILKYLIVLLARTFMLPLNKAILFSRL